jgi:hypothetical protein
MKSKRKLERMKNLDINNQERNSGIKTEREQYKINKQRSWSDVFTLVFTTMKGQTVFS